MIKESNDILGQTNEADRFAHNAKVLRDLKGWSQHQAAKKLGVSQPTIREIEQNHRMPRGKTIIRYCRCFNVSADVLLFDWLTDGA